MEQRVAGHPGEDIARNPDVNQVRADREHAGDRRPVGLTHATVGRELGQRVFSSGNGRAPVGARHRGPLLLDRVGEHVGTGGRHYRVTVEEVSEMAHRSLPSPLQADCFSGGGCVRQPYRCPGRLQFPGLSVPILRIAFRAAE